jgi:DNA (cytosine-5)-methyltransferase 1
MSGKGVASVLMPDRYEVLEKTAGSKITQIVEEVPTASSEISKIIRRMNTANRGAFLLLRGDSGSGKSTFLHTLNIFHEGIATVSVPSNESIKDFLHLNVKSSGVTVFVLEEREALKEYKSSELESWIHDINGFIRSSVGARSIVVWPCNTDDLRDRILPLAKDVGGKALLGSGAGWFQFDGPSSETFPRIAARTLGLLNSSASISDLGLSETTLAEMAKHSSLIGDYLADVHEKIEERQGEVETLLEKERCRLWVLVAAGNEPNGEVDGLTRGAASAVDIEKLMSSTGANIVAELKKEPDRIGVVGTVLDAKIFHLPILTANAVCRNFADETLAARLRSRKFAMKPLDRSDALSRVKKSEIGKVLNGSSLSVKTRGVKSGPESRAAFEKLAAIASNNDSELNRCIGRALQAANLIDSFDVEKDFGDGLTRRTDLVCRRGAEVIRVEVMWRKKTFRADIANYVLGKISNYGRAIGFLGQGDVT